jgi:DNA polymerase elongation subunit (family B)
LNGYKFFLDTQRISTEDNTSYFEILYNDFEGVTDEDGNEMSIAKEFIVFIRNYEPKAIFVLVFDALLETYALRRVKENGVSFKLTFLNSNEGSESIDFLTNYIIIENL